VTISLITFDLDNTLWDVEPALIKAEDAQQRWLAQHRPKAIEYLANIDHLEFKKAAWKRHAHLSHDVTRMRTQTIHDLLQFSGYSDAQAQSGAEQAFEEFLAARQNVELYSDALSTLRELASRYTIGALTNGNADIYKTPAGKYFDFSYLAEDVGAAKPAPDMFMAALERTGVSPEQTVHIGDDPHHDIHGAKEVGIRSIWMNSRGKQWPELERADVEITTLSALPEALLRLEKI